MDNGVDDLVVTNTESSEKDLGEGLMASSLNNDMQSMRTYSLDVECTNRGKGS